jgi:hypothetical protein
MTAAERESLRNLQDRFLELPEVSGFINRFGEDESVFEPGSPSIQMIRSTVLPAYEHRFREFVAKYERKED